MEQPKLKDLLKALGELEFTNGTFDDKDKSILHVSGKTPVSNTVDFQRVKQAIKSLKKENKRLRKENEELIISNEGMGRRYLKMYCEKPVAEFKCANTNMPSKDESYMVIVDVGGNMHYSIAEFEKGLWKKPYTVIAFTETDPGEIASCFK